MPLLQAIIGVIVGASFRREDSTMSANRTDNTQRHGRDLRLGRISLPGQVYALTSVTHERARLFTDISLGRIVVKTMGFHHEKGNVVSLAFVIMPDHFHWLIALTDRIDLPGLMHSLTGPYGQGDQKGRGGRRQGCMAGGVF